MRSRFVLAGLANSSRLRSDVCVVVSLTRLACAGGSTSAGSGEAPESVRPRSSLVAISLKLSALGG